VICVISKSGGLTRPEGGDDSDYLQYELSEALNLRLKIIPVLVDGGTMPPPQELPESIRPLAFLQAVELRHQQFDRDVEQLFRGLSGERFYRRRSVQWGAGAIALLIVVAGWWNVARLTRVTPYQGNRGEVVLDPPNQLMWRKTPNRGDVSWYDAVQTCSALRLGGYASWRLPTNKEIIIAHGLSAVWSQLALDGVRGLWTSSSEGEKYAWAIYSLGETETLEKTDSQGLRAVCVRNYRDEEMN
jgi:Protein of unknown function (DUF1566)